MLSLSKKLALLNHNLQQLKKKRRKKLSQISSTITNQNPQNFSKKISKEQEEDLVGISCFFFLSVMQRKSGQKELAQGEFSAVEKS